MCALKLNKLEQDGARVVETDGGTTVAAAKKYAEEIANSYLADKGLNVPPLNGAGDSRQ
jgi:hypothetical protein